MPDAALEVPRTRASFTLSAGSSSEVDRTRTGRDLGGSRQMHRAVRRKSPGHVTLEDLTDSSLLGTGEHGGLS
jgi:hypothetical protein